jgi:hypothetical protein
VKFNHPFRVSVAIKDDKIEATFTKGFVNWREPKINGVAISGTDSDGKMRKGGPPVLQGDLKYDKYNRCYICLKVKVDDDGTMPEDPGDDYLSVVISKGIRKGHDLGRQYWLHPIAVIAKTTPPLLCQNVYFNLLHWVGVNTKDMFYSDPAPKGAAERYHHYFSSV